MCGPPAAHDILDLRVVVHVDLGEGELPRGRGRFGGARRGWGFAEGSLDKTPMRVGMGVSKGLRRGFEGAPITPNRAAITPKKRCDKPFRMSKTGQI